jgi:hypothetical protein
MLDNLENIPEIQNPPLNLLKKDILGPFFKIKFELNISKIYKNEGDFLFNSDITKQSKQKRDEILLKLQELNIENKDLELIEINKS